MNNENITIKSIGDFADLKNNIKQAIKEIGFSTDALNDKGFGRMFARAFKDVLRYNKSEKNWFYYNGKVWIKDLEEMNAKNLAKIFSDEITSYGEELNLAASTMTKIYSLTSLSKRNTIVNDAKCEYTVTEEDFDTDIYLLNLQNGTMDLRTFELKPHNANDMLSKICNVRYDPNVICERWERFISEIMEDDRDKTDYLQRILGFCLSGATKHEQLYIFYGPTGRNGKSALLQTVSYLLGGANGYSGIIMPNTFSGKIKRNASSPSSDIAVLKGIRMAMINELPQNMLIDTEMLKNLTGRDKIKARKLYGTEFEFEFQLKLIMNTNYLPKITDNVMFGSGRTNVIEFNRHFSDEEQDKDLKDSLKEDKNLSGILNWLLAGFKKAYEDGIKPPKCVMEATNRFMEDCDKIGCFISECLEKSGKNMTMKDLYDVYRKWTSDNGYACEGKYNFKRALESKNILQKTGTINGNTYSNVIVGYTLKSEYQLQNTHPQTEYEPRPPRVESQDPTSIF